MVSATLVLATAMITETALSFLGFGLPSNFPTWGQILYASVPPKGEFPERVMLPGLEHSLTELAANYPEKGERRRRWMTLKRAAEKVNEPELARILKSFDPERLRG